MKTNKKNRAIIGLLLFCLLAMYGSIIPVAKAASLTDISDTISTSRPGIAATHTIVFKPVTGLAAGDFINVTFPATFTGLDVGNATCPSDATEGVVGQTLSCEVVTPIASLATSTITVTDVTNPAKVNATAGVADTYQIYVETTDASDVLIERADAMVAVVEAVTMTATVEATLGFTITGVAAGQVVNGIPTTADSSATSTPFGTIVPGASSTVAQQLNVTTNATDGYVVTVMQDHELLSNSGDDINSFDNSPDTTGSTTPHAWAAPLNTLDAYHTYGHMGLTTNDQDYGGTFRDYGTGIFNGSLFAGLNGTAPMGVMSHDGPSNGTAANIGEARVAYSVEISALQEAGDYTSTLTYVCTPQF